MVKIEYATVKFKGREIRNYLVKDLKEIARAEGLKEKGLKAELVRVIGKHFYDQKVKTPSPTATPDDSPAVTPDLSPVASPRAGGEPRVDIAVPGIIGVQHVIATPAAADIVEPQIVADPVDIVTLLREIQEVNVPDVGERKNIERAIFRCLGLDTGMIGGNKFEFNNDIDGMFILETNDELRDGEII